MRRIAGARLWGILFLLNMSCAVTLREAVQKDVDENFKQGAAARVDDTDGEASGACPPNKIQHEDCRVTPCKVTCEDPKGSKDH